MLTLDRTTLFYHNLREASRAPSNTRQEVAGWAAKIAPQTQSKSRVRRSATTPSLAGNSQRTGSSSAVTKSSGRSALGGNVGVKVVENDGHESDGIAVVGDDGDNKKGGLSDCDETRGEECQVARNSPKKGKVRGVRNVSHLISGIASSTVGRCQALVSAQPGRRGRPRNEFMPQEALVDNAWRGKVIPTLFQWAGTQSDPWNLGETNTCAALQLICQAVYGDLDLGLDIVDEDKTSIKHPSFTHNSAFRLVRPWHQPLIVLTSYRPTNVSRSGGTALRRPLLPLLSHFLRTNAMHANIQWTRSVGY
jgi:hypothetical protein